MPGRGGLEDVDPSVVHEHRGRPRGKRPRPPAADRRVEVARAADAHPHRLALETELPTPLQDALVEELPRGGADGDP
jgi:hypothetical protein